MGLLRVDHAHEPSHHQVPEAEATLDVLSVEKLDLVCVQFAIKPLAALLVAVNLALRLRLAWGLNMLSPSQQESPEPEVMECSAHRAMWYPPRGRRCVASSGRAAA